MHEHGYCNSTRGGYLFRAGDGGHGDPAGGFWVLEKFFFFDMNGVYTGHHVVLYH